MRVYRYLDEVELACFEKGDILYNFSPNSIKIINDVVYEIGKSSNTNVCHIFETGDGGLFLGSKVYYYKEGVTDTIVEIEGMDDSGYMQWNDLGYMGEFAKLSDTKYLTVHGVSNNKGI